MAEITRPIKKIDFNHLKFTYQGDTAPIDFIDFKGHLHIFKSIYNGDVALEYVEKDKKKLKSDLGQIRQGPKEYKSDKQLKTIENVENLYESKENVVQMFISYPREKSRHIYESQQAKRLKILTPKQMLQRLPISLAQIKAGNNPESLLNEIRQIVYSLHQSKEITKRVYNYIIKSIKV